MNKFRAIRQKINAHIPRSLAAAVLCVFITATQILSVHAAHSHNHDNNNTVPGAQRTVSRLQREPAGGGASNSHEHSHRDTQSCAVCAILKTRAELLCDNASASFSVNAAIFAENTAAFDFCHINTATPITYKTRMNN